MSYLDRLRPGRYVSPSGREFSFQFDELSREGGKKNAVLELPQQDRAVVQDLGAKAVSFGVKAYFSGPDYDKTADGFWGALAEHGPGLLSHPRWGDVSVLALSYGQSEDFVEELGRAVFDISFIFAPGSRATVSAPTAAAVVAKAQAARAKAKASFVSRFNVPALRDLAECKDRLRKTLTATRKRLMSLTGSIAATSSSINSQTLGMLSDVDALVASPQTLADSLGTLITSAADAPLAVGDKLSAYGALLADTLLGVPASPAQAALSILTSEAISSAALEASASGDITSRIDAVADHDTLAALAQAALEAIERAERGGGWSADPETMQGLALAAAIAKARLLEESFSLRVERRVILDGASHPLELSYRFHGDLDHVDELVAQNHFGGDYLLVVPAGTEVRYYAE